MWSRRRVSGKPPADVLPLPAPPGLRAGARFALAPGLPRNDVGHEKGTSLTVGPTGGLLGSLAGISSGSGSARLGLSQKGDLPSSGEPVGFCWFKVANARRQATVLLHSWVCRCRKGGAPSLAGLFLVSHAPCNQPASRPVDERACWSPSRSGSQPLRQAQAAGKPTHRCANFSPATWRGFFCGRAVQRCSGLVGPSRR